MENLDEYEIREREKENGIVLSDTIAYVRPIELSEYPAGAIYQSG